MAPDGKGTLVSKWFDIAFGEDLRREFRILSYVEKSMPPCGSSEFL